LIVIIVIIIVIACLAGGGYAGYKYWSQYRAKLGAASSNPLYEDKKMGGENPLFVSNEKD